ncbi:hypothetical protein D9Y22_07070 [Methylorubrum sp. DB1722]|nr:hypothetical protein [Methylorubrum sp. DB1722]
MPASAGIDGGSRSRATPGGSFEAAASRRHLRMRAGAVRASRIPVRKTTAATGSHRRRRPAGPRRRWRSRCRSGSSGPPR